MFRKLFVLLIMFGFCFSISFNSPTFSNNTYTSNTSFLVNSTFTDSFGSFYLNVNGINYDFINTTTIAYYNFNNVSAIGENDTFAVDLASYSSNLTCVSSTCPTWNSSGKHLGAFTFDGTDDSFNASNSALFNLQTMTIEGWMYLDQSVGDRHAIVSYGTGTTSGGPIDASGESFALTYDPILNSFRFRLKNAAGANILDLYSSNSMPSGNLTNRWVFVTATWNGSDGKIYKDGSLINSGTGSGTINYLSDANAQLRIGNWFGNNERWFKGSLDEIRLYNYSVNQSEVLEHYYSNLKKTGSTSWEFYSNHSSLSDGIYVLSTCYRNSSLNLSCTENRTITIDATAPTTTAISPSGASTAFAPATTDFSFSSTDALSSNLNCTLFYEGSVLFNSSVENSSTTIQRATVGFGSRNWFVSCTDLAGNIGNSSNVSFSFSERSETSDDSSLRPLSVSLSSSCSENIIETNTGTVRVTVLDQSDGSEILTDRTDESGNLRFESCGKRVLISARKSGYQSTERSFQLDSCSCSQIPVSESSTTPTSTVTTLDIADSPTDSLNEVDTSDAPAEISSSTSQIIEPVLNGPSSGIIGQRVSFSYDGCDQCSLVITYPNGQTQTLTSETEEIELNFVGTYTVSLVRNGVSLKAASVLVSSTEPSRVASVQNHSIPPTTSPSGMNPILFVFGFVLIVILAVGFFFMQKKKR